MTHGAYDPVLVAVSVLIAIFASFTALDLANSVAVARGRVRAAWLAGGALAMGAGIWSMHFVGMLAFRLPGVPIAYPVPLLVLSVVVAIIASLIALLVVSRSTVGPPALAVAGLAMGGAICGMHYIGIWSMRIAAKVDWDGALVLASIVIAAVASIAALWLTFRFRSKSARRVFLHRVAGGVVMGIAISGMHYTAMLAMTFPPLALPTLVREEDVVATDGLAVAVTLATLLLLGIALAGSSIDRVLTRRRADEAEHLARREETLRRVAGALSAAVGVEEALQQTARAAVEFSHALGAYVERIVVAGPDGEAEVVAVAGDGTPPLGARVPYSGSLTEQLIESGEPDVITEGAGGDQIPPYLAERCRGCPALIAPLRSMKETLGTLVLLRSPEQVPIQPDEVRRVSVLSDLASAALGRLALLDEIRGNEARLRAVLDALPVGVFVADADGRIPAVSRTVAEIWGEGAPTPGNVGGYAEYKGWWTDTGQRIEPHEWALARAIAKGEISIGEEIDIETFEGQRKTILNYALPIRDDGRLVGAVAVNVDVTERKKAEDALRCLAEASRVLASSLDYEETLRAVARLAVPRIADWCAIYVLEGGELRRVGVAHQDPTKVDLARELERRYPPDPYARTGIYHVLRTGESELHSDHSDSLLRSAGGDTEYLRMLQELGLRSGITVPLVARDRVLGAIELMRSESGRRYDAGDLGVAEDLARRAALAIDNTHLFREAQVARERVTGILESITDAFFALDREWRFTYVNQRAEEVLQRPRGEILGKRLWDEFPEAVGSTFFREYHRAMAEQVTAEFEEFYPPLNTYFEVRAYPSPEGLSVYFGDVTERRHVEQALRDSEERFRAVAENATVAIFVIDEESTISFANPAVERMFGFTVEEMVGRSISMLMPAEQRPLHHEGIRRYLASGRRNVAWEGVEFPALTKDGRDILLEISIGEFVRQGKRYFTGIARDITLRKRAEEALRSEAERRNAIIATQQEIATAGPKLDEAMQLVAERSQRLTGATGAAVEMVEGSETVYRAASGSLAPFVGLRLDAATSLSGYAVQTKQVVKTDDTERDERVNLEATRRVGARSMILVPLFHGRSVVGALKVAAPQPSAFDERDVDTLQLMSGLLAAALARAAALEAERALVETRTASMERQRFLADATSVLGSSLEYEEILRHVARVAVPRLGDWCIVYVGEEGGQIRRLAVAAHDPINEQRIRDLERRYPATPGHLVAEPVRTKRPILLPEVPASLLESLAEDQEHLQLLREIGFRSVMVVPLIAHERLLGAIALGTAESGRIYGEDDLGFTEDLARRASIAIENARLYREAADARREAERRAYEEAALRQAAGAVSGAFTTEEVIRRIAESALAATDASGAFVERIDIGSGETEVVAVAGDSTQPLGSRMRYSGSFAERVVQSEQPEVIEKLSQVERPLSGDFGRCCPDCSAAVIPLIDAGEPIGALFLVRMHDKWNFRDDEIARAVTFGQLASLAFRKVHLLEESERRRQELLRVTESRARLMRGFSHDVKNPLGAADLRLQMLNRGGVGGLTDTQQESVDKVRRSIQSALGLIEDLMELVRAEAGQIEIRQAPTDIRGAGREIAEEYRAKAEAHGLSLEIAVPDEFPVIESDGSRVRQILGNLLSNAVKYTPAGRVTVRVDIREGGNAPGPGRWATVDVSDTGPGIPREQLELLFQEFRRLETAGETRGAGIGLAISQRLARALGGDITVVSEVGAGSTFTLWLPLVRGSGRGVRAA